ncbi:EamA family transporter [Naumannella sp. ID2617S]|nr:EamA family transporter [Naumannella sp. ID2617S]
MRGTHGSTDKLALVARAGAQQTRTVSSVIRDRTWLVALAASLWGFSGLLRAPLSKEFPSVSIVLGEHVLLVLLTSPLLIGALRAWWRAGTRTKVATVVIGAGSSALATVLFTLAFRFGDPVTPQVLQKLQPLIAITLAALLLGERMRPRFWLFVLPALAGAWLLAFPNPLAVGVKALVPALLGVGSAALWALGTVLGRMVSSELKFFHVTALRFLFGMLTLLVVALGTGSPLTLPLATWPRLLSLALVPGLLALVLYYFGLRSTAASRATLAELAFPLTAAAVGVLIQHARLAPTQWVGFVVVLATVVALAWHERSGRTPAVAEPDPAVREPATTR